MVKKQFKEVNRTKKVFLLFLAPLWVGLMGMESCFPGDGQDNNPPLDFGLPDHGPPLSYIDNGDGTATDKNTGFMWEIKTGTPGTPVNCLDPDTPMGSCPDPHNVNNRYKWSDTGSDPDGTLFTLFLERLNNACDGDPTISCDSDADCGSDGPCGFAGYRDWCAPNVKRLQSIVDYGVDDPSIDSTFPGPTQPTDHWSSTTFAASTEPTNAWTVYFGTGSVNNATKTAPLFARAVRPCDEDGKKFGF